MEYEIIDKNLDTFKGTAWLVEMSEEIEVGLRPTGTLKTRYFIISTARTIAGYETYIFPGDENGEPRSWTELPGSQKDTIDREAAVSRLVSHIEDGKIYG